jgi:hypothetical protein
MQNAYTKMYRIQFSIQTRIEFCFGFESGSRLAETQIQNFPSHIFFIQCQFIYLYTITERHTNNSCSFYFAPHVFGKIFIFDFLSE